MPGLHPTQHEFPLSNTRDAIDNPAVSSAPYSMGERERAQLLKRKKGPKDHLTIHPTKGHCYLSRTGQPRWDDRYAHPAPKSPEKAPLPRLMRKNLNTDTRQIVEQSWKKDGYPGGEDQVKRQLLQRRSLKTKPQSTSGPRLSSSNQPASCRDDIPEVADFWFFWWFFFWGGGGFGLRLC